MISDFSLNKGVDESAHLFSQYSEQPIYYYQFAHRGPYENLVEVPPNFEQGISYISQ